MLVAEVAAVSIDNNGRKKKNEGSKNTVVRALQRGLLRAQPCARFGLPEKYRFCTVESTGTQSDLFIL